MRVLILSLLLAGCAAKTPCPPCPPLPQLGVGEDLVGYATTLASLYEHCAGARQ